jgi:uncharacterized protein YlaI
MRLSQYSKAWDLRVGPVGDRGDCDVCGEGKRKTRYFLSMNWNDVAFIIGTRAQAQDGDRQKWKRGRNMHIHGYICHSCIKRLVAKLESAIEEMMGVYPGRFPSRRTTLAKPAALVANRG